MKKIVCKMLSILLSVTVSAMALNSLIFSNELKCSAEAGNTIYGFNTGTPVGAGFSVDTTTKTEGDGSLEFAASVPSGGVATWSNPIPAANAESLATYGGKFSMKVWINSPQLIGDSTSGIKLRILLSSDNHTPNWTNDNMIYWNYDATTLAANQWNTIEISLSTGTSVGSINYAALTYLSMQVGIKPTNSTFIIRFDELRPVPNSLIYGFNSDAPSLNGYAPNTAVKTEGDSSLAYIVSSTTDGVATWQSPIPTFNAGCLGANSGKITVKVWISNPSIIGDSSTGVNLNFILSSDNHPAWMGYVDNMIYWNKSVSTLIANTWNTIDLPLSEGVRYGSINFSALTFLTVQTGLKASSSPFTIRIDEMRPVPANLIYGFNTGTPEGAGYLVDTTTKTEGNGCLGFACSVPNGGVANWSNPIPSVNAGNFFEYGGKFTMRVWINSPQLIGDTLSGIKLRIFLSSDNHSPNWVNDNMIYWNYDASLLTANQWNTIDLPLSTGTTVGIVDYAALTYLSMQVGIKPTNSTFIIRFDELRPVVNYVAIDPTLGSNISSGKTATASSYIAGYEPSHAIDGLFSNRWISSSNVGPHWLKIDLGQTYRINDYIVYNDSTTRSGTCTIYNTADYQFQISKDGTNFTTVDTVTNNASNVVGKQISAVGRYVRLYITQGEQDGQSDQYARICQLQVFGTALSAKNSKIVTTIYPTEDIIIADYDATDYGADPTGVNDSTSAIQQALNDCFNSGGGTVWLPAGTYKTTNQLDIPSFVTLRGDWRDPDIYPTGSYGTVISAQLTTFGTYGASVCRIGGSAGVIGLTIYYPNQNINSVVDYNYTFFIPGWDWASMPGTMVCSNIINCTLLNSYRGIGINAPDYVASHALASVKNVKGTVLYTGLASYNSGDVSKFEYIFFSNSYWVNAGSSYNAPTRTSLDSWTRANGTGFLLGDDEWDYFNTISCSDYNYGIHIVAGVRVAFCGQFLSTSVQNTNIAVKIDNMDTRSYWGMSFLRCSLTGSIASIQNNTSGNVKVCDSLLYGPVQGNIISSSPWTSTGYTNGTRPKVTRNFLYNVSKAPYNAPFNAPQTGIPTADATPAIQAALNDAQNAGGGIVYLPAGWYRINTHLTVPGNVELRGSSSVPEINQSQAESQQALTYGTVLMGYEGQNTATPDTATALVTLNGNTAGVNGLMFFYPNNNPKNGLISFPYTIRGNGSSNYIVNIGLINSYNAVDLATNRCDNHFVRAVIGMNFNKGIVIGASTQGWIEDCHTNPGFITSCNIGVPGWVTSADFYTIVLPMVLANQKFIIINGASNEQLLNNFAFGCNIGILAQSSTVNAYNFGTDWCGYYCVRVDSGSLNLMNFMGDTHYGQGFSIGTVTVYNKIFVLA